MLGRYPNPPSRNSSLASPWAIRSISRATGSSAVWARHSPAAAKAANKRSVRPIIQSYNGNREAFRHVRTPMMRPITLVVFGGLLLAQESGYRNSRGEDRTLGNSVAVSDDFGPEEQETDVIRP